MFHKFNKKGEDVQCISYIWYVYQTNNRLHHIIIVCELISRDHDVQH